MSARRSFWSTLLRNRRGNGCTACLVLVEVWTVFILTWAALCFHKHELLDVPRGVLAFLTLVGGLKAWTTHVDAKNAPAPPPPPAN